MEQPCLLSKMALRQRHRIETIPWLQKSMGILKSALCFTMITLVLAAITNAETNGTTKQVKTLEIPFTKGTLQKIYRFPVYEQGPIQYFSAGLGKEERSLTYPAFPLKLVFVQGERAFLAGVSVEISKNDGPELVRIPGKDVEGPWLFVNIPTGTYTVKATTAHGHILKKTVTIQTTSSSIIHFRWP